MNIGKFKAQINAGWKLIENLCLGEQRRWYPDYSVIAASQFRKKEYSEKWRVCYEKGFFDFQLIDGSLVQFRMLGSSRQFALTYIYLDCPYIINTYQEYLKIIDTDYITVREIFREEYEAYILDCDLKVSTTPIRYDYDEDSYEEGIHPTSHLHIGDDNNLRVGAENIWWPLSFLLFIIRQCYPTYWKILTKSPARIICQPNVRENLREAPHLLEGDINKMEVVLT